ncbi:YlmH family RNA-binding protein [Alkalibacillus aidingensis]|uniref:YlmH family RNA-binding protein n=1 Tax=Alkalibacillus aidingensis TaxID=2747607 RepID=UPI00166148EF|nr:RNA-binding protein [Alkalibacillus aidingensis]
MDIYQHFRPEEQPFIDQVTDWLEQADRQYRTVVTDFLDPREQLIFSSVVGQNEQINLDFYGGYHQSERKRAVLAPFYETIENSDFTLSILQGNYPTKFVSLSHRDLLGTLMSLGIQRKKIGDLLVEDGTFQIICDRDMAFYLKMNLTKIKNTSIKLSEVSEQDVIEPQHSWQEKEGTVSSIRLDAILKEIYQLSRQKAQDLIEKEAVKVNYRVVDQPAFQLQPGDLLSVKSFGRSKVVSILGETRKNKLRIKTAKLK